MMTLGEIIAIADSVMAESFPGVLLFTRIQTDQLDHNGETFEGFTEDELRTMIEILGPTKAIQAVTRPGIVVAYVSPWLGDDDDG